MLVAPAGYGKTTLAQQWLEDNEAAWYTGTSASTDVAALAARLVTKLPSGRAGQWRRAAGALAGDASSGRGGSVLAGMLAADLVGLAGWIVARH